MRGGPRDSRRRAAELALRQSTDRRSARPRRISRHEERHRGEQGDHHVQFGESSADQYCVAVPSARLFDVASGSGSGQPVGQPRVAPTQLRNDYSWEKGLGCVPEERIQDAVLKAFSIDFDGVDPLETFSLRRFPAMCGSRLRSNPARKSGFAQGCSPPPAVSLSRYYRRVRTPGSEPDKWD